MMPTFRQRLSNVKETPKIHLLDTIQECENLFSDKDLLPRAKPNQRLGQVFNIDNAFTTIDGKLRSDFVKSARKRLATKDDKCYDLTMIARQAFEQVLKSPSMHDGQDRHIPLVPFLQAVAFIPTAERMFPGHGDKLFEKISSVRCATEAINKLWIESKMSSP